VIWWQSRHLVRDDILERIPVGAKSIFDPCCGRSTVLLSCLRRGMEVLANDVNGVPYWFSRYLLSKDKLTKEETDAFLKAKPVEGWFTKAKMRKEPEELRKRIDGLAVHAQQMKKKHIGLGVLADTFTHYFTYMPIRENNFSKRFEEFLEEKIKQSFYRRINFSKEAKVLREDIQRMNFPKVDVVYFDPPYDSSKYEPQKFLDCILEQKEIASMPFNLNDIPQIVNKLSKNCKIFLMHCEGNIRKNLEIVFKSVERVQLQTSRNILGGKDIDNQLWVCINEPIENNKELDTEKYEADSRTEIQLRDDMRFLLACASAKRKQGTWK